jgi:hypothetical protein
VNGPTAQGGTGWHPDPYGRHRQRWWDGTRWTEHVFDDVAGTDPPPGAPSPGGAAATADPVRHLRRILDPDSPASGPTPAEQQQLAAAGHGSAAVTSYILWRRSVLLVILPALSLAGVLSLVTAADTPTEGLTPLGVLLTWLPAITVWAAPIGALVGLRDWTHPERGSRPVLIGWGISVIAPILVALVPLEGWIDVGALEQEADFQFGVGSGASLVTSFRVSLAIGYAATLLPTVVSVPSGVLRGGSRIKALLPHAPMPGWFLVAVSPFAGLLLLVAFVLLLQLAGTGLLTVAVALLTAAPLQYLFWRRAWTDTTGSPEAAAKRASASRVGTACVAGGLLFLVIWALTAEVIGVSVVGSGDDALLSWLDGIRTLIEVGARGLLAGVVFAHLFLRMSIRQWRDTATLSAVDAARYADDLAAFGGVVATGEVDPRS